MSTATKTAPVKATVDEFIGWVTELATIGGILVEQVDVVAPDLTFDQAVALLDSCRGSIRLVDTAGDGLARRIAEQWTAGQDAVVEVNGVEIEVSHHREDRREWDHEGLMRAVVKRKMAALEPGQVPDPYTVGMWVLEAALPSYWRLQVLDALGIDAAEFARRRHEHPRVDTRRRDRVA